MFNDKDIIELLSGSLSEESYNNILATIGGMVNKYKWPRTIIVSNKQSERWEDDDIKELAHSYFEWLISNDKLKYIVKIPRNYIGYYFAQMLVSFVSDRIKIEQSKSGLSFRQCKEIVYDICQEDFIINEINNEQYVCLDETSSFNLAKGIDDLSKYLPKHPIDPVKNNAKSMIRLAVEDVVNTINGSIPISKLYEIVYMLCSIETKSTDVESVQINDDELNGSKYEDTIQQIVGEMNTDDASMILDYLFQDNGKTSLSKMEEKYNIPRSTIHYKMEMFRQSIGRHFKPDSEEDGIRFLKKLATVLDEIANSKYDDSEQ